MLKTQKVFWWRIGFANTEGKLGNEPDGEMGFVQVRLTNLTNRSSQIRADDITP